MAWYSVRCAVCGKEERVQLYGPVRDREWKAESHVCLDCWRKAKTLKEVAGARLAMAGMGIEGGLPELKGTAKQVAWAEGIRARLIAGLGTTGFSARGGDAENSLRLWREVFMDDSAKTWIDRRLLSSSALAASWRRNGMENRKENENA